VEPESDDRRVLTDAVSDSFGQAARLVGPTRRESLDYDAFLPHRRVHRLSGDSVVAGRRVGWSLIEKVTEGPGLASPYLVANAAREFAAYRSGFLGDLGSALRAPRLHAGAVEGAGRTILLLEEVRHAGPRPLGAPALLQAARALGGMAGAWRHRDLGAPWLFRDWIRRHSQPEAMPAGVALLRRPHPDAVALLGARLAAGERLIAAQPTLSSVLEALPQTLCHHDVVGANIFVTSAGTVLIDWESIGPGPVGADLASLLFSSVRRGDASAAIVVPLGDQAFHEYLDGCRDAGGDVSAAVARRGFDAAIALRWKLIADIAAAANERRTIRRGSLPDEPSADAMVDLVALTDLLLRCAARALEG
jgi:hypothetical protein